MSRNNLLLTILALIQIALVAAVFLLGARPAKISTGPLLTNFDKDSVTGIKITDDSGKTLELAKQDFSWVLPAAGDFPTNGNVESFLDKLANLSTQGLIARSASSYQRLSLADDDFVSKIELEGSDKRTVYLGSSPTGSTIHVRSSSSPEVFLAQGLTSSEASSSPASWIDTSYLSLTLEDITTIKLKNAGGSYDFVKNEAGEWTLADLKADELLDPSKVSAIAGRFASLFMQEPLGKNAEDSYGLGSPQAVVTITTETLIEPVAESSSESETSSEASDATEEPSAEASTEDTAATHTETPNNETRATDASSDAATRENNQSIATEPVIETKTYLVEIGALLEDGYAVRSSASEYIVKVASSSLEDLIHHTRADFMVPEPAEEPAEPEQDQ